MPIEGTSSVTRAEWTAIFAVFLNILTLAFVAGIVWQQVQDHDRRLGVVETQLLGMGNRLERIDANVLFLAERAREDREREERR